MVIVCESCGKSTRASNNTTFPYLGRARRPCGPPVGKMLEITCSGKPYEVKFDVNSNVLNEPNNHYRLVSSMGKTPK